MEVARSIRPVKLLSEGHCDEHNTYKGMRCMDCELWICGMCGVLYHKLCRTILVEEAYEEVKMEVSLSLEKEQEERNTRIDKINDSLKVLDVKRKELIEELKNCEKKIEELESLKLKEENLCENVNLVKQINGSSSTYEEFSNAKKDIDSLREIGKQHFTIEIKLEETAPEETSPEEQMPIEVVDCLSLSKEPLLEMNSEMSEVVKILSKEWGDIPSVNGDDLNKANQNEIMPTNSSDVEMAEPEVDKRKRLSSEGSDSVTNSPVKSKKPCRQPLVEQTQNSLNTPSSKDGFSRKRISRAPRKSTDSESDINEDATITQSADILPADLFSILDRKMNQIHNGLDSPITKDSGHNFCSTKEKDVDNYAFSDIDHEVIPKRCLTFTNSKPSSAKKRIRSERIRHEDKRAGDNAEISKLLEYIRTLRNQQSKVKQELSNTKKLNANLKWKLLNNNGNKAESDASDSNEQKTSFGSTLIDNRDLSIIDRAKSNSIFVKDLAVMIWGEDTLVEKSVSGKVAPHLRSAGNHTAKPALTPQKLLAMRDYYKKRLINQGFRELPMRMELSNLNKYIGEKINDLRKSRRRLTSSSLVSTTGTIGQHSDQDESSTGSTPAKSCSEESARKGRRP